MLNNFKKWVQTAIEIIDDIENVAQEQPQTPLSKKRHSLLSVDNRENYTNPVALNSYTSLPTTPSLHENQTDKFTSFSIKQSPLTSKITLRNRSPSTPVPVKQEAIDLSHLSAEEKSKIESVLQRAKMEESLILSKEM